MRLRPTPKPVPETLTSVSLPIKIDNWLDRECVYSIPGNRHNAAQNLTYAVIRAIRGSDVGGGSAMVLADARAELAARRLRRAAALFIDLADRLED